MTELRIDSGLEPETEALATQTIGALIAVHQGLGCGMSESV